MLVVSTCQIQGTAERLDVKDSMKFFLLIYHSLNNYQDKVTNPIVTSLFLIIPYSVSQKIPPPTVFWHFFPNGWEFFNQFLHTYYTFLFTLDYKFLFNCLQLWQSYAILSATTQRIFTFLYFTRSLTSKFAYWANDVTVDVMSYPTCLLTL